MGPPPPACTPSNPNPKVRAVELQVWQACATIAEMCNLLAMNFLQQGVVGWFDPVRPAHCCGTLHAVTATWRR